MGSGGMSDQVGATKVTCGDCGAGVVPGWFCRQCDEALEQVPSESSSVGPAVS
jgi:hypothetical protein